MVTYDGLLKWNYNFACYKKCHGSSDDLLIYIDSDGLNMGEVSLNKYYKIQRKLFKPISMPVYSHTYKIYNYSKVEMLVTIRATRKNSTTDK